MRQGLKVAKFNDFLTLSEGWHELFGLRTIKKKLFNLNTSAILNDSFMPALSLTEISNLLNLTVSGIVAFITLTLKAVYVTLKRLSKRMARIKSFIITVKIGIPRTHYRLNVVEKYVNLPINFFIPLSAFDRTVPLFTFRLLSFIRDLFFAEYQILPKYTFICLAVNYGIISVNDFSAF
jgi:hypothetical protein